MEITSSSKLLDVLKAYPFLEEQIISIAPPFKNLRHPVLRRTVGQLATIERIAQIGGLDVDNFVNTLRRAAGQAETQPVARIEIAIPESTAGDPDWIAGSPQFVINGTEMLSPGEVPLGRVNELLVELTADGFIVLVTDFEPIPIIEAMQKQDRRVVHKLHPDDSGQHLTYIAK